MNNKGFTLIELLATVVILGIVMGITAYSVLGVIEKSKDKSEKIFVDKLENAIDAYISDARTKGNLKIASSTESITYTKCKLYEDDSKCINNGEYEVTVDKMESFDLSNIKESIQSKNIVNPKNKKVCQLNGANVSLYRDSDMVYYYYINLGNLECDISEKYQIITNIPDELCNKLQSNETNLECDNNEK